MEKVDYVEIGGVKWMKCNLGAEKETDYGLFFPWGSLQGVTMDENKLYKFEVNDGESNLFVTKTKGELKEFGIIDDDNNLTEAYDAVAQSIGNGWRMPTKKELQKLIRSTNSEWISNFKDSGVDGRKYVDKKDPTKYIFIPASGFYASIHWNVNIIGLLWSSTMHSNGLGTCMDNSKYCGDVSASAVFFGGNIRGVLTE